MTTPTSSARQDSRFARASAIIAALALVPVLAACGGEDPETAAADVSQAAESAVEAAASATDEEAAAAATSQAEEVVADAEDMVEDMKDDLEEQQAAQGGGSATLTVGDETWDFDRVLCAIGEEETGQEGAEFVLSSIQDGLQLYVSIDSFGHSVSLNDIEDFENPSVSLSTFGGGDFIELDGKTVSGAMTMTDDGTMEEHDASFEGTCP